MDWWYGTGNYFTKNDHFNLYLGWSTSFIICCSFCGVVTLKKISHHQVTFVSSFWAISINRHLCHLCIWLVSGAFVTHERTIGSMTKHRRRGDTKIIKNQRLWFFPVFLGNQLMVNWWVRHLVTTSYFSNVTIFDFHHFYWVSGISN